MRPEGYDRLLPQAGSSLRDLATLQLFLQTSIRVSELRTLTLSQLDLAARILRVGGEDKKDRVIDLEKKAVQAFKSYPAVRSDILDEYVCLSDEGKGRTVRGVRDTVEKCARAAGITKPIRAHSLRQTFATYKAERGVPAFHLKEWLGHSSVATAWIYAHMRREGARKAMEATSLSGARSRSQQKSPSGTWMRRRGSSSSKSAPEVARTRTHEPSTLDL